MATSQLKVKVMYTLVPVVLLLTLEFAPKCLCATQNHKRKIDYNGYSLLQVTPATEQQLLYLNGLWKHPTKTNFKVDFWEPPGRLNHKVIILIGPKKKDDFRVRLESLGMEVVTKVDDIGPLIERENLDDNQSRGQSLFNRLSGWAFRAADQPMTGYQLDRFNRYDTMRDYLQELAIKHPKLISIETIGNSIENRSIVLAKISGKGVASDSSEKPSLFIDAGIHAREWIVPAVAMYIIHTLVTHYHNDSGIRNLVDNLDWHIVPMLNPDGYEYSGTTDRMWRKNRRTHDLGDVKNDCEGVDLNRNFDWKYGTLSSSDACFQNFHGRHAFSEPESRALRDYLLRIQRKVKGYITMHSYSQMWLLPYGHRRRTYSSDYKTKTRPLALEAAKAIEKIRGTKYDVGSGADLMYLTSGGSDDWAKDVLNVTYVYSLELSPHRWVRTGNWGFIVPRAWILPVAREIFEGISVVAEHIRREYPVTLDLNEGLANETVASVTPPENTTAQDSSMLTSDGGPSTKTLAYFTNSLATTHHDSRCQNSTEDTEKDCLGHTLGRPCQNDYMWKYCTTTCCETEADKYWRARGGRVTIQPCERC